ncbi:MAG TPA: helix-turn-helix domain-containing protein [Candidatus Dormibacteraeota bacterium]
MTGLATESKPHEGGSPLPPELLDELGRRRQGLARHMARAVISEVRWDRSTGVPPRMDAISRACEAGLDLFLATAREARPPSPEELRRVAQLGILQARGSLSVEPVLAAYRIAARVAWDAILRAWRDHPGATPEAMVVTANYVFTALDQVAAEVTRTYLTAREQHLDRGTRARARLVHALLTDTFESETALQKQALAVNVQLATTYVVVALRLQRGAAEDPRGGELLAELLDASAGAVRTIHHATDPHAAVLLWPATSAAALAEVDLFLRRLELGDRRLRLRAAIGGYHQGLRGVSRSYLEATQALELGRRLHPETRIQHHDELIPLLLLAQSPHLAERYVQHLLGRLLDADRNGSLLETLDAYLAAGSVKEAAAALHLHRHTVLYRLDKLRELVPGSLDDPGTRTNLRLALDVRKLL